MSNQHSAPHLLFNPLNQAGEVDPDICEYLRLFGVPEALLEGPVRDLLAYLIARFIGTTPRGERTNVRMNVAEPTGEAAKTALRLEHQFGLHNAVIPEWRDRIVHDLLLLMGTAKPSRLRWAFAATYMSPQRVIVMAARDRFLADSQPQDCLENIIGELPEALPVDVNWQKPSADDVAIGTESHLARWVIRQSPVSHYAEVSVIDAKAADPSKRASTDDGFSAYIRQLAAEEADKTAAELESEHLIAVVSSNPHWIFQALSAERHIRDAIANGTLKGNYRVVVVAYPLDWGLKTHVYVLGGVVRAILQWAMLKRPDLIPSTEEIIEVAEGLKAKA